MQVGIVNANELTSEQLYRLWGNLGCPPVVVLGNEAEKAWKASQAAERVPYRKVPHPQYMRRFQHQQTRSYGAEIKKAMR